MATKKKDEKPGMGHNSGNVAGVEGKILKSFIERIERLEDEKKELGADIRDVYAEAKANGFDTKIMRKIISLRKMDESTRDEQTMLISIYARALGMTVGEMYA